MFTDAILRTSSSVRWTGSAVVNNSKTPRIWLHHRRFLSQKQTLWDSHIYIAFFSLVLQSFSYISLAEEEIKTVSDVVEGMEVSVPSKGKVDIWYFSGLPEWR